MLTKVDRVISHVNNEELESQFNRLKCEILGGFSPSMFQVYNMEAGTGKTLACEGYLAEAYHKMGVRTLLVRFTKEDGLQSAERINTSCGENIAYAINGMNIKKQIKKIASYPIVVITHSRYQRLAHKLNERGVFAANRGLLVIDEKINMVKMIPKSKDDLKKFELKFLNCGMGNKYNKIVANLLNILENNKKRCFSDTRDNNALEELKLLKDMIRANHLSDFSADKKLRKRDFYKEIDELIDFFNKTVLLHGHSAYTYVSKYKWWMLDGNNILLDASGGFDQTYGISDLFSLNNQAKVVDYSSSRLHVSITNSCKTKRSKSLNYEEAIKNHVIMNNKANDKILVVTNKADCKKYDGLPNTTVVYFGNLIGSNAYRDYNKVYIVHTHQFQPVQYVLDYMFYADIKIDNKSNWDMSVESSVNRFKNQNFEKMRVSCIASETYQAIKRINRNNDMCSDIYLFSHDRSVIELVKEQFMNIQVVDLIHEEILYPVSEVEERKAVVLESSFATKAIGWLRSKPPGSYPKKELCMFVGVRSKDLSRKVLQKVRVENYMESEGIIAMYKEIIIPERKTL